MASKGNLGIEINLNKVPCRETKMTPYEINFQKVKKNVDSFREWKRRISKKNI